MRQLDAGSRARDLGFLLLLTGIALYGCQTIKQKFSDHLTHWNMLEQNALEDPIKAVGGDGIVFTPIQDSRPLSRTQLAAADPKTLVSYYSPIFVQQRVNTQAQRFPYPPEYDMIGQAHLRRENNGTLKSYVAGPPRIYVIFKKLPIDGHEHVQLTYTAWYPAHPKMKTFDLEAANIDSCVVRITLDAGQCPALLRDDRRLRVLPQSIRGAWRRGSRQANLWPTGNGQEVLRGAHGERRDRMGGRRHRRRAARDAVPARGFPARRAITKSSAWAVQPGCVFRPTAEKHPYEMTSYEDLYRVAVDGSGEQAGFFDMASGGKVRGAERGKEKFFLSFVGVDSAGQPRADNQIKMHFDESTWGDPTIYSKYLRLPPGSL